MSTKIYNGFRVNTGNMRKVHALVNLFRSVVLKLAEDKMDRFVTDSASFEQWRDRRREMSKTGRRDPIVDTQFSLTFFPSVSTRFMLGIAFCEHQEWIQKWIQSSPLILEYHYQDQTDQPSHLSIQEWKTRRRLWDRALPDGIPSLAGFSIDLVHEYEPFAKSWR